MITDDKVTISIIKNASELCTCILYDSKYSFLPYKQECFYELIKTEIAALKDNSNQVLVVFVKTHNTEFVRALHYTYSYRKQNNIPLPRKKQNLFLINHLLEFLNFLILEYFDYVNNNQPLPLDIINPIFRYNFFSCVKNVILNINPKRIVVIPNIT